jgi:uncharacterized protein (TIGR03084 family)
VPVDIGGLCDDLVAETAPLLALVAGLDEAGWSTPTPAARWTVRDQLSHLAYFDDVTTMAVREPDRFLAGRAEALADVDAFTEAVASRYRSWSGAQVAVWLERARAAMIAAFRSTPVATRVPWYGPDMALGSAVTARIMETWAHGRDVTDALGAEPAATPGLRHVAFLGVRTLDNSFRTASRPVPDVPVMVELAAPGGAVWRWGEDAADNSVRGPALDFCLVVTQRRHVADTGLRVDGPVATEWMTIAQAYAGPPGAGRRPGQFRAG